MKAYEDIHKDGLNLNRDSDIAAFVKLERYFESGKAPRMIMGRNPKFNIAYAQIIEPIEKAFFALPQVANACDYHGCGKKFEDLVGGWFMENDMSKFEGSQRYMTLQMEHMVYSLVLPDQRDLLDTLFAYKIRKKGHTNTGVNFDFWECRGSGDMDTSLGNGILNYIATQYFLIENYCRNCELKNCKNPQCKSYKFVVKGDDSYSSIPKTDVFINTYTWFGFDAKIVIRKTPEDVEFCSGHFVEYQPGKYTYVQKLKKLIESLTTCINADVIRNGWVTQYYKSLGLMYKQLYKNVPIYEDIANFLIKIGGKHGLNVNLITSYNLISAFNNVEKHDIQYDQSLIFLSISLVNKMDYGELNSIKEWFNNSTLTFDPKFCKRSNLRTPKLEIVTPIDYIRLNQEIGNTDMPKAVKKYYLNLKRDRSKMSDQFSCFW